MRKCRPGPLGNLLWLLPTLGTFDAYESDRDPAKPAEPSKGDRRKLRCVTKQRLQLAEKGRWDVLLKHYMADLELDNVLVRGANSQSDGDLTLNAPDDASTFKRVAHKVEGRTIRSARQILMGSVPASQTNVTFDKAKELAAARWV